MFESVWRPPVLQTKRLVLRPVTIGDAEDIFSYASKPEVTRFCFFDTHKTLADARYFIENIAFASYSECLPEPYCLTLNEGSGVIGTVGAFKSNESGSTMEIGYIIDNKYWGQGLVVEACQALTDHLFNSYAVNRIQIRSKPENTASARVADKLGYTFEGVLRDAINIRGGFWDLRYSSLLRSEWIARGPAK